MSINFGYRTKIALLASTVLTLMTFTFPSFFFFNPFANGQGVLAIIQLLSIISWFALILLPPIILCSSESYAAATRALFLVGAVAWPATLIFIRVILSIAGQGIVLKYLADFPIFFFSDLIVPITYILMWRRLPKKQAEKSQFVKDYASDSTGQHFAA